MRGYIRCIGGFLAGWGFAPFLWRGPTTTEIGIGIIGVLLTALGMLGAKRS